MTGHNMPRHEYSPAQYASQKNVESFGNIFLELEVHHITHTYHVVPRCCQLGNIDYLALIYFNTGAFSYKEFSEEWLFDGET
jgi:hypothetical protein